MFCLFNCCPSVRIGQSFSPATYFLLTDTALNGIKRRFRTQHVTDCQQSSSETLVHLKAALILHLTKQQARQQHSRTYFSKYHRRSLEQWHNAVMWLESLKKPILHSIFLRCAVGSLQAGLSKQGSCNGCRAVETICHASFEIHKKRYKAKPFFGVEMTQKGAEALDVYIFLEKRMSSCICTFISLLSFTTKTDSFLSMWCNTIFSKLLQIRLSELL